MIIFFSVVFPVTVAARDAAKETDPALYALARSAGASRWQSFWQITLPALLPALLTSLRLGVGTALALLFLVEGYGTDRGIGYYILDCWSRIDYLGMYGGIDVYKRQHRRSRSGGVRRGRARAPRGESCPRAARAG